MKKSDSKNKKLEYLVVVAIFASFVGFKYYQKYKMKEGGLKSKESPVSSTKVARPAELIVERDGGRMVSPVDISVEGITSEELEKFSLSREEIKKKITPSFKDSSLNMVNTLKSKWEKQLYKKLKTIGKEEKITAYINLKLEYEKVKSQIFKELQNDKSFNEKLLFDKTREVRKEYFQKLQNLLGEDGYKVYRDNLDSFNGQNKVDKNQLNLKKIDF